MGQGGLINMTKSYKYGKVELPPRKEQKKKAKKGYEEFNQDEIKYNQHQNKIASEQLDSIYFESMAKLNKNMGEALLKIAKHHISSKYDKKD